MKKSEDFKEFLIVALDFDSLDRAKDLVLQLGESVVWYKVGMELFFAEGRSILKFLKQKNKKVFLDLKIRDIPRTVERACRVLGQFGCELVSVFGDYDTVKAALFGLSVFGGSCRVVNVSVLTSQEADEGTRALVLSRALETLRAGGSGVVSSAQETAFLRKEIPEPFLIINPGIRLKILDADDQKRVATPQEAYLAGASQIVVGRPITQSTNPCEVVWEIYRSLECVW